MKSLIKRRSDKKVQVGKDQVYCFSVVILAASARLNN